MVLRSTEIRVLALRDSLLALHGAKKRCASLTARVLQATFACAFFVAVSSIMAQTDTSLVKQSNAIAVDDTSNKQLSARALRRLGSNIFRPAKATYDLAISPDGKFIVSMGSDLAVWEAASGRELWSVNLSDHGIRNSDGNYGDRAVVFGNNSEAFFTTGKVNEYVSWDVASGRKTAIEFQHGFNHLVPVKLEENSPVPGTPTALDVSPDGKMIALSSALGVIVANQNGEVLAKFKNQPADVVYGRGAVEPDRLTYSGHYSVGRFSSDGKKLAVLTSDAPTKIRIVDLMSFATQRTIPLTSWLVRLDFSPDGNHVATTERDASVRLYDVTSGQQVWSHTVELHDIYENYTSGVAFSPDGSKVAVCATDKSVYLLESETGKETARFVGHKSNPYSLVFSDDSKTLYSSGGDALIRRWNINGPVQVEQPTSAYVANGIAASPVSHMIAFDDDRGIIHLVDSSNGTSIQSFNIDSATISAIKFSPNGKLLGAGGIRGNQIWTIVWNLETFEREYVWEWQQGADLHANIEEIAFSSDLTRIAAVSFRQGKVFLWDLINGKQVAAIPHKSVYGVSFSPTEPTLATGGWDSKVRFWNSRNGQPQAEIDVKESMKEQSSFVYHVCYSPEGRFIAVGHGGLSISLWNTQTLELRSRFKYHPRGGWGTGDMNFSPDGLWLCSADMSSTVKLWDPYSGQKIMDVSPQGSTGSPVEFGSNGTTLVSGPFNGFCYVWDVSTPRQVDFPSTEALWNALAGNNASDAYNAFWALTNLGDQAVTTLDEKFDQIVNVLDAYELTKSLDVDDAARRNEVIEKLVSSNSRTVRIEAVKRSMALLSRIGSEKAQLLLQNLASDSSVEAIREEAHRVLHSEFK